MKIFFRLTLTGENPDECQSKSFEKMNTLLSAIFKFCTTKILLNEDTIY